MNPSSYGDLSFTLSSSMDDTAMDINGDFLSYDEADKQYPLIEVLIHHIIRLEDRIEELENVKD